MNSNILAVIPGRGGSKGIKRKNIRLLCGKPLIFYQIQNALKSNYVTDTVVTSEDLELLDYASNYPVYIRERPFELAADKITLDPVVYDATNYIESKLGKKYDIVVTLQPTSPLFSYKTLDSAIDKFISDSIDTLLPVTDSSHLQWKEENGKIVPDYNERLNRQWLPKKFEETGAFLITKRQFVKENTRFGNNTQVFLMDDMEGMDIDNKLDWIVTEAMIKRLKFVFISNGNKQIGMGHVYRTITIADQLFGHDVSIITYQSDKNAIDLFEKGDAKIIKTTKKSLIESIKNENPDIIINDILDTSRKYILELKKIGYFVVNFEDLGNGSDEADLVFNALYEKTNHKPNHRFSYQYECLNERFLLRSPAPFKDVPRTLLLTFGGVDQNNMSYRILKLSNQIFNATPIENIIAIVGAGYSHYDELKKLADNSEKNKIVIHKNVTNMPKIISQSDVAITSNGRTIFELAVMGIPTISIAQNDRETLHLFARYDKGIKYLGIAYNLDDTAILKEIKSICSKKTRYKMHAELLKAGKIIRNGTSRVIDEVLHEYWRWKNEWN